MSKILDESELQALREQHGDVRDIVFEDEENGELLQIVLRRPIADRADTKRDEFFAFWTRRAVIEQTPQQVQDATKDGTAELLLCLVHPDIMAVRKHLADYPGDAADLRELLKELAGDGAVKDAPELVTDQVKESFHRRAFGVTVGGRPVIARPLSGAEYATFITKNGGMLYPMRADALAWAAWSCVSEQPDKDKAKPGWDAIVSEYPMAAILLGVALLGAARSRVKVREKKSTTPSAPLSEKPVAESSVPVAGCSTPSPPSLDPLTVAPAASI